MNKEVKSLVLSMILPMLFIIAANSPAGILGYYNRELAAIGIAVISIVLGFVLSLINLKRRIKGRAFNPINLICAFILTLPAIYLVLHFE
ncbi:MAG: hypothetical protein WCE54_20525 [Ignavibacteriaceae bacterium]